MQPLTIVKNKGKLIAAFEAARIQRKHNEVKIILKHSNGQTDFTVKKKPKKKPKKEAIDKTIRVIRRMPDDCFH